MSGFSEVLQAKIESYLTRYETRRSAILPVLHAIQDEHGWIHEEHVEELHQRYALDRIQVKEVITFYDIYKDKPVKKHLIRFCKSLTCHMMGAAPAMAKVEAYMERSGSEDMFELEPFPCLGKCDGAPVMLVGKERFEHVTADKVDGILESIKLGQAKGGA
jgi:NADH:ubiquinone oxidoreductase subunit E